MISVSSYQVAIGNNLESTSKSYIVFYLTINHLLFCSMFWLTNIIN